MKMEIAARPVRHGAKKLSSTNPKPVGLTPPNERGVLTLRARANWKCRQTTQFHGAVLQLWMHGEKATTSQELQALVQRAPFLAFHITRLGNGIRRTHVKKVELWICCGPSAQPPLPAIGIWSFPTRPAFTTIAHR